MWRARTALSSPDHTLPDHAFPYTGTMAPRVTWFAGEARNRIVCAISSGFGQDAWSASGIDLRLAGVSMVDGAMRVDQNAVLHHLLGERDGERGDRGLGRRIGHHAGRRCAIRAPDAP